MIDQRKGFDSDHSQDKPGFSYSQGIRIIWDEAGDGARPETVLRMALERVEYLDTVLPCAENVSIRYHLEAAIEWEEIRNKRRKDQKVQGTLKRHNSG